MHTFRGFQCIKGRKLSNKLFCQRIFCNACSLSRTFKFKCNTYVLLYEISIIIVTCLRWYLIILINELLENISIVKKSVFFSFFFFNFYELYIVFNRLSSYRSFEGTIEMNCIKTFFLSAKMFSIARSTIVERKIVVIDFGDGKRCCWRSETQY